MIKCFKYPEKKLVHPNSLQHLASKLLEWEVKKIQTPNLVTASKDFKWERQVRT